MFRFGYRDQKLTKNVRDRKYCFRNVSKSNGSGDNTCGVADGEEEKIEEDK